VASDITLAAGDGSRRITYVEPADPTRDPAIRALEHAVAGLCEQLTKAEQRAALAERDAVALRGELGGLRISERVAVAEVAVLHQQLEVTERQAGVLRTELAELRKTEQTALDWAKTSAAEASDLRKKADDAAAAERIARDEAAGLRAELDARRQWGLGRRLRWALGRKR
jgi:chromosome segregation ATPase